MIDAEDILFGKDFVNYFVKSLRGGQISAERLLNDDARALRRTSRFQLREDLAKQNGWDGEIVEGIFRAAQFLANVGKRLRILIVPVNVPKFADELGKAYGVDSSVLFDAVLRSRFELFKIPARLGHANYGPNQLSSLCQLLQRGKDLLVSEVAGSAKKDQSVGMRLIH